MRSKRRNLIIAAAALVELGAVLLRAHRLGGVIVVRCRENHLFKTIWIPGVSIKSLRLGLWRFQRCPVGAHWSLVTPVNEARLSPAERQFAAEHRDIRVP